MSNEKKPDTNLVLPPTTALETDGAVTGEVVYPPVFEQNEEAIILFFKRMSDQPVVTRDIGAIMEELELRPIHAIERPPHRIWSEGDSAELLRNFIIPDFDEGKTIPFPIIPLFPNTDLENPGSCQFCNAELTTEFPSRLCPTHGAVDCEGCLRPFTRDENHAVCTYCNKVHPEPIEPSKADQAITAEQHSSQYSRRRANLCSIQLRNNAGEI